jgi:3-oxoacyl-[acyl-carrier protein] reductase
MSEEKSTVVVCGYGGIGKAVVKKLITQKKSVIIFGHTKVSKEEELFFSKNDVLFFIADVTDEKSIVSVVNKLSKVGSISGLVFAATNKITRKKLLDLTTKELQDDFTVTVFGFFTLVKNLLSLLIKNNGASIVAITSSVLEQNHPPVSMGGYVTAKAALRLMLRQLAQDLAQHQIRVNAVAPSFIRTPLHDDVPVRFDSFLKEKNIMNRMVSTEDVAMTVCWLLSKETDSITGATIPVTCGDSMNL